MRGASAAGAVAAAAASFASLHINRFAVEDGYRLSRGYPGISGWEMPAMPLLASLADVLGGDGLIAAPFSAACAAAAFALGARLHSREAGALSAACAAAFLLLEPSRGIVDLAFVVQAAAFMAALALWCDDDVSLKRRAHAVGFIAGAAVWVRTSSLLLPAAFILFEALSRRKKIRQAAAELWPAAAWPLAMCLPWTLLHWLESGRLLLLEAGRADSNLIAGALGLTGTIEGDARALAGLREGTPALSWALQESLLHPARSLLAVWKRLAWTATLHPILAAAGAAAAWRLRKNAAARRAAALAGGYWAVHCLAAVEPRYLPPVWLLAVCLLCACLPRRPEPARAQVYVYAALLPLLFSYAQAAALCLRRPPAQPFDYAAAASAKPHDAWRWSALGRVELEAGSPGAAASLIRAYELRPDVKNGLALALGQIAAARRLPIGGRPFHEYLSDPEAGWAGRLVLALAELDAGRPASARRAYDEAALLYSETELRARGPFAADRAALARLRAGDPGLRRAFDGLFASLPYALRLDLARRVPEMGLADGGLLDRLTARPAMKENH